MHLLVDLIVLIRTLTYATKSTEQTRTSPYRSCTRASSTTQSKQQFHVLRSTFAAQSFFVASIGIDSDGKQPYGRVQAVKFEVTFFTVPYISRSVTPSIPQRAYSQIGNP